MKDKIKVIIRIIKILFFYIYDKIKGGGKNGNNNSLR